jgi:hypothetical protein
MKSFGSNSECELKRRIGMGTRVRSSIVLLAFVVCVCSASAHVIGAQAPARQPSVTTGVVYGHRRTGWRSPSTCTARHTPTARASCAS